MTLAKHRKLLPVSKTGSPGQPGQEGPDGLPPGADRTVVWLLAIICVEAAVAVSIRLPLLLQHEPGVEDGAHGWILNLLALLVVPFLVLAAGFFVRKQHKERIKALTTSRFMDMVLHASREWLWAIDADGRFTFSGPACKDLTGYEPSELLGRHFGVVIDPGVGGRQAPENGPGEAQELEPADMPKVGRRCAVGQEGWEAVASG